MSDSSQSSPLGSKSSRKKDAKPLDPCNVFVKYLPSTLRDDDLATLFRGFGSVLSSKIMLDPVTRQSLGFGFVRFSNASEAQDAIFGMDGHRMGPKRLLCKLANSAKMKDIVPVSAGKAPSEESILNQSAPTTKLSAAQPRPEAAAWKAPSSPSSLPSQFNHTHITYNKIPSTNLYIKNLLPTDSEDTLLELFGTFGEIDTVKIMTSKNSISRRCIGFVRYKSLEHATKAIEVMNGVMRSEARLVVKYADEDSIRNKKRTSGGAGSLEKYSGQPSYGMMGRHVSPMEGRTDTAMRRSGQMIAAVPQPPPQYLPIPWPAYQGTPSPYGWAPAIFSSAHVYDAPSSPQWMFVYPTAPTAAPSDGSGGGGARVVSAPAPLAMASSGMVASISPYGYPIAAPLYYNIDMPEPSHSTLDELPYGSHASLPNSPGLLSVHPSIPQLNQDSSHSGLSTSSISPTSWQHRHPTAAAAPSDMTTPSPAP